MDKLVLPFVFIPDGSPEALLPPRYGHIRLRARFIPAGTAEAAGTSPASGPDGSGDAGDGWQSDPGRGDAWTDDAGAGTATSPVADEPPPGSPAAIGRSLLRLVRADVRADVGAIRRGMPQAASERFPAGRYELAQAEGEPAGEERLGPEGEELSLNEQVITSEYYATLRELREVDPYNSALGPSLRSRDWKPSEVDLIILRAALSAARAGLPPRLDFSVRPPGSTIPDAQGPGRWVPYSPKFPYGRPEDAVYQMKATGLPWGMEYRVETTLTPSGEKYFDNRDPFTGNFIDAKNWQNFPPEALLDEALKDIRQDANPTFATDPRFQGFSRAAAKVSD
ncbi:MAG TPA: hypothetical protein VJY39_09770 [Acidisphaera sp.]|nr:hypothetical protein [Acidisphaera sp.]